MRLNLPPDETTALPLAEQPDPKRPRLAEIPLDRPPEIGDLLRRDELQRVVGLGLAHQLADQIRARCRLRIVHDALELFERHLRIPQEVRSALLVDEAVARGGGEHRSIHMASPAGFEPALPP